MDKRILRLEGQPSLALVESARAQAEAFGIAFDVHLDKGVVVICGAQPAAVRSLAAVLYGSGITRDVHCSIRGVA